MKSNNSRSIINIGLVISNILSIISDFLLQIEYHIGNIKIDDVNHYSLGINYEGWISIHKTSISILSILMIFHIISHRQFYNVIIKNRLLKKNRHILMLSFCFALAVITGLSPWLIEIYFGRNEACKIIIEIHDKIAIIYTSYLIHHIYIKMRKYKLKIDKMRI
ncbi:hypothetical protein K5X82_08240 [Halosquirtibacter xylanolyticus]|uniref:hypothetical protein n=1 Tax=Halosquirtibacter xylanolyticus TaxID=3374599 RepID=UPI003748EA41|nr:hypothetical protein K5X82_08240 [Prolixibacteraceae bacterium]